LAGRCITLANLKQLLLGVEKPGRYTGGEHGAVVKEGQGLLRVALSYPDLYEIGMSNLSLRLLYRMLNGLEGVACERVFAPAPDFEAVLRAAGLPLYSLETGSPLREFDVIGFSIGYELTFTNMLAILDLGGIGLFSRQRGEGEPIVIAGGPAVTNPVPFGPFLDGVFIGEAEAGAAELFGRLAEMKRRGAGRDELLGALREHPAVWHAGKRGAIHRAFWRGFGAAEQPAPFSSTMTPFFPIPNLRTVQDHGVIEIMRGCPNGCRFCHAGIFYRPFRLKEPEAVLREAEHLVLACGYREISLSSLSAGDYPGIAALVRALHRRFQPHRVSFSLPSLRIDSLTLELFSELSSVRKSGLTFAVETPRAEWQQGINKLAPLEKTLEILQEARSHGWKAAKFYFMVGLPLGTGQSDGDTEGIIDFLLKAKRESRMSLNVNVACFIPKPHTPFQWAAQLTECQALERIQVIKRELSRHGVKVHYHSPFLSLLEGVISRGDERAGMLAYQAFRAGARLDAWEDRFQEGLWRDLIAGADWDVVGETCRPRVPGELLAWRDIRLGVSEKFLEEENRRCREGQLTEPCRADCGHPCGVCGQEALVKEEVRPLPAQGGPSEPPGDISAGCYARVLFSFTKLGKAAFLGHLDMMQVLERALARAGYLACFTEGFNPKPRLEFAQPLALGIESREEIAAVELQNFDSGASFRHRLGRALPQGVTVTGAKQLREPRPGVKKQALMALYWGSDYLLGTEGQESWIERHREALEKGFLGATRQGDGLVLRFRKPGNILKLLEKLTGEDPLRAECSVTRTVLLATDPDGEPVSYFSLPI